MKVLGIIPARGGSKGVKKKNIKLLGDKPLIQYTIDEAKKSILANVVLSTDDPKIAEISAQCGLPVPFMRPELLATDSAKSIPVMQHALSFMEEHDGVKYDAIMMLQPTTPFRLASDINEAIEKMEATNSDSVISVIDVEGHHPARMKYLENGTLIDPAFCEEVENQPRQELRPMYLRNGAIYLTKKEVLLNNSFKGNTCQAQIMPLNRSANIDTEHDFAYAQWILKEVLKWDA